MRLHRSFQCGLSLLGVSGKTQDRIHDPWSLKVRMKSVPCFLLRCWSASGKCVADLDKSDRHRERSADAGNRNRNL